MGEKAATRYESIVTTVRHRTHQSKNDLALVQFTTILLAQPLRLSAVQTFFDVDGGATGHEESFAVRAFIGADLDDIPCHVEGCVERHVIIDPRLADAREELSVGRPRAFS